MSDIPVTMQNMLLVNPCMDRNDPTCRNQQEILTTIQNDLVPYSAHIVYPRTSRQDAYEKTRFKKNNWNLANISPKKFLKGKEKKLFFPIVVPAIIAGTSIIVAIIERTGKDKKG